MSRAVVSPERGEDGEEWAGIDEAPDAADNADSNDGDERDDNTDHEESEDDQEEQDGMSVDIEEEPMDETEEELEKLVFGDEAGFRDEIHRFAARHDDDADTNDKDDALAGIQDADLFFLDAGPDKPLDFTVSPNDDEDTVGKYGGAQPAWHDSDDDRMTVSLMAIPRLRKLRTFEGEDVISGREYTQRLRRQYRALHPTPQWSKWEPAAKRRRASTEMNGGDADLSGSDMDLDDDDDAEYSAQPLAKLLRSSQSLTRSAQTLPSRRAKLRPEVIAIERMKDIGPTQPHAITCLSIHPALPLLLSSGLSSTLYLHHLQPRPTPPEPANPLITSLHLKHTPLTTAAFSPLPTTDAVSSTDPRIFLSSRRRYFHTWTLPSGNITKTTRVTGEQSTTQRSFETLKPSPCGRYLGLLGTTRKGGGVVNILDAHTTQWVAQARVESRKGIADFAWWSDGRGLCIAGRDGEVSEWSVEERRTLCRWADEGQVGATVIALGGKLPGANASRKRGAPGPLLGPDRFVVTGSTSGVVNIYDRGAWGQDGGVLPAATPTPLRTLSNLVTPISHVVFSPCGQVMAMSSRWKRDALRLVHLPTCAVYKNWPTSKTPLGRISGVALGEWTDYTGATGKEEGRRGLVLAVGNEQGVLRGWEITG